MKRWFSVFLALFAVVALNAQKWTFSTDAYLIFYSGQMTANSFADGDGNDGTLDDAVAQLIDFDESTYYHSAWTTDGSDDSLFPTGEGDYHYLQFDLEQELDSVVFHFVSRQTDAEEADIPCDIDIMATNDDSDEDSWTTVYQVTNLWGYDSSASYEEYTSDPIIMGTAYRYFRFVVKATSTGRTNDLDQQYFSLAEINWYEAKLITDEAEILALLVDSVSEIGSSLNVGTDPGFIDEEVYAEYEAALQAAEDALNVGATDEEYEALGEALVAALVAAQDAVIPMVTGYYYIVNSVISTSTDEDYNVIEVEKALYSVSSSDYLFYGEFEEDENDLSFVWYIEDQGDGTYTVQNYETERYISLWSSGYYYAMAYEGIDMVTLDSNGDGSWCIFSAEDPGDYCVYPYGWSTTWVVSWPSTAAAGNYGAWYLREVSESLMDSLEHITLDPEIALALDSANALYNQVFSYDYSTADGLITSGSQISSNAQDSESGSFDLLIDGETSTGYFLSEVSTGTCEDAHFLQVTLSEAVDAFVFTMWGYEDNYELPTKIRLFATNDDEVGGDVNSSNDNWTEITCIAESMPEGTVNEQWYSTGVGLGDSYKYLRFVVENTVMGYTNATTDQVYFRLSEFQLYNATLSTTQSAYYNTDGVAEVADSLKAAIDEVTAADAEGTTTWEDLAELRELTATLRTALGDPTAFNELLEEAESMLDIVVVGEGVGYISQEALDAYKEAIEFAQDTANVSHPSGSSILAGMEVLEEAMEELIDAVEKPQEGTWYYIISACDEDDILGRGIYTPCGELYGEDQFSILMCGGNEDGDLSSESRMDPRFMWRIEDAGDGGYYIENRQLGEGTYAAVGSYVYYANYTTDKEAQSYTIDYVGYGAFNIGRTVGDTYYAYYALPEWYGTVYNYAYSGLEYPRAMWEFEEVDESALELLCFKGLNNSIRVQTLAFNVSAIDEYTSIMDLNADNNVSTFSVLNITTDDESNSTTIELQYDVEFEAGEPFVLMIGDPDAYTSFLTREEEDTIDIFVPLPTDYVYGDPGKGNGLVGVYAKSTISTKGLGYFDESVLNVTDGSDVTIGVLEGYFDPRFLGEVDESAEADYVLTLTDGQITSITAVNAAEEGETVNVYDLNGRLLKANVSEAEAKSGLQKGIYIIGGKKVIVK